MGTSRWSDDVYTARQNYRSQTGQSAFAYDVDTKQLPTDQWKVHGKLNPFRVKVRESRDSDVHPESIAIAVFFDETGSMGEIPVVLQTKLKELMALLVSKGYVEHPQILFGAFGDATCDHVPLQVGQFESGIEMDDDLGRILLEGNGGGQVHESYGLPVYFIARHSSIDCYEKRGQKGFLFTIGDEMPWDPIDPRHIRTLIGDNVEGPVAMKDIIAEVTERYEYFHIIATGGAHGRQSDVQATWRKLLGERVILLDDPTAVCETIASTIGMVLGKVDLDLALANLRDMGVDLQTVKTVGKALVTVGKTNKAAVTVRAAGLPIAKGDRNSGVKRL